MYKKLRVDFTGFWPNFKKNDNYFFHLLKSEYELIIDNNNPDVLFYSVDYANKREHLKKNYSNSKKIFYTGENIKPDFNKCDAAFSFMENSNKSNYRLPLWALHINWFGVKNDNKRDQSYLIDKDSLINKKEVRRPNNNFCSFLASNNSGERLNFVKKLDACKRVDSSGKLFNNTKKIIKGRGDQKWKIKYLSKFRFNIAFENAIGNGYVTEKIIHPMSVNSIPIYWGSPYVKQDFNEESFIYVNDFENFNEVVDYIMMLENNLDLYLEKLNKPIFKNNSYPEYILPSNVLKFIKQMIND